MMTLLFHSRWCRFRLSVLIGELLVGAVVLVSPACAQERYDLPATPNSSPSNAGRFNGGTPAATTGSGQNTPPTGSQPPAARSPLNTAAPATNGSGGNLNTLPNSTGGNPYGQGPAAGGSAPHNLPLSGINPQPISGSNQPPAASTGYPAAPPASAANSSQASGGMKPSGMMRAMLSPPAGSRLQGRPMSLQEVISGAQNRSDQTLRVEAYWDLCSSIADYYLGLREAEELQRLRSQVQSVGATWAQAETELNIRVGTSQRAAAASQMRLASLIGRGSNDLPLPADTPHCASYDTQFDRIFPRGAPAEARELAVVLPARYAELKNAAAAVERCEQLVEKVASGDSDGTKTLRTLELLALQRRAFVQIARDYNRRIARYAELASPGQLSPTRLTAMLILTNASATMDPSYSAPPRNRQSNSSPSPPRTFAESPASAIKPLSSPPPETGGVRPASAEQGLLDSPAATGGDEKSLLVH